MPVLSNSLINRSTLVDSINIGNCVWLHWSYYVIHPRLCAQIHRKSRVSPDGVTSESSSLSSLLWCWLCEHERLALSASWQHLKGSDNGRAFVWKAATLAFWTMTCALFFLLAAQNESVNTICVWGRLRSEGEMMLLKNNEVWFSNAFVNIQKN